MKEPRVPMPDNIDAKRWHVHECTTDPRRAGLVCCGVVRVIARPLPLDEAHRIVNEHNAALPVPTVPNISLGVLLAITAGYGASLEKP